MNLTRREFVEALGAASVAGLALGRYADADAATAQQGLYDSAPFGNVSFLHFTDCHAQLKPSHFREPSVNIGVGGMRGQLPHLVGEYLLRRAGIPASTELAHAFTCLDFERAARRYGKLGGFADGLLYRRGNFNGSWDQLICDALIDVQGAEIAFSPGFRWGTTLLPGDAITREAMMDPLAITYPYATVAEMTGETIKTVLEDVADNLFNPDPYYQQGGDMVRVGGLAYACDPAQKMGSRIADMRLRGKPIEAGKRYKVAGWAPVAEEARSAPGVKPVWDVVESWLAAQRGRVAPRTLNTPALPGVQGNPGLAAA